MDPKGTHRNSSKRTGCHNVSGAILLSTNHAGSSISISNPYELLYCINTHRSLPCKHILTTFPGSCDHDIEYRFWQQEPL